MIIVMEDVVLVEKEGSEGRRRLIVRKNKKVKGSWRGQKIYVW